MSAEDRSLWSADQAVIVPANATSADTIVPFAKQLRQVEQDQLRIAFENGLYVLGTEFVWRRSLSTLKSQLGNLSMKFVAELLGRTDIREDADPDLVLTDYEAISIASQLGMITTKATMDLRQSLEKLSFYANPNNRDTHELEAIESIAVLKGCVSHILSQQSISVSVSFTDLRRQMQRESISQNQSEMEMVTASTYFFKRVILRTLLADAEQLDGQPQQFVLDNLVEIGASIWPHLLDDERWAIGQTYAKWAANNLKKHVIYVRNLLMRVQGFDYVPESLRSNTFVEAAANVLKAHEGMNNYYNEPSALRSLASLGTTFPGPATKSCMRAVLACWLGNFYGNSIAAESICDEMLRKHSKAFWTIYAEKALVGDEYILNKLLMTKPWRRWIKFVNSNDLVDLPVTNLSFLFARDSLSDVAHNSISQKLIPLIRQAGG